MTYCALRVKDDSTCDLFILYDNTWEPIVVHFSDITFARTYTDVHNSGMMIPFTSLQGLLLARKQRMKAWHAG